MFTGELKVGDRLIWRHVRPIAYAPCLVTRIDHKALRIERHQRVWREVVWMSDQ